MAEIYKYVPHHRTQQRISGEVHGPVKVAVGQNIQAQASDKRAEATYKDADAVLHEAVKIQEHLSAQDEQLSSLVSRVEAMAGSGPRVPQLDQRG